MPVDFLVRGHFRRWSGESSTAQSFEEGHPPRGGRAALLEPAEVNAGRHLDTEVIGGAPPDSVGAGWLDLADKRGYPLAERVVDSELDRSPRRHREADLRLRVEGVGVVLRQCESGWQPFVDDRRRTDIAVLVHSLWIDDCPVGAIDRQYGRSRAGDEDIARTCLFDNCQAPGIVRGFHAFSRLILDVKSKCLGVFGSHNGAAVVRLLNNDPRLGDC